MSIVHGNYNNTSIVPLLVDSYGRAIVTLAASSANIGDVDVLSMPVTQVKSANNNHIFSYESFVAHGMYNTSLPAGTTNLDSSLVPTNKLWCINSIKYIYVGTVGGLVLRCSLVVAGNAYDVGREIAVIGGALYGVTGSFYLPAGGYVRVGVDGATAGDDIYTSIIGYQMDVS